MWKKTYHIYVLFNKSVTELIGSKINLNFKKLNLMNKKLSLMNKNKMK